LPDVRVSRGSTDSDSHGAEAVTKKAAVCVDDWKLPVFRQRLDAAGYKYEEPVPFTPGTSILQVHYEWVHEVQPVIEAAERECAESKQELTSDQH
jgi:hypothetical protein